MKSRKIILLTMSLMAMFISNSMFAQCDSKCGGKGLASTWSKNDSYCLYRYVKVTNLCSVTKKIVIEIMKNNGKYQTLGGEKIKPGESRTVYTCSNSSNYRWVVVDDDCYNSDNWTYGE